MNAKTARIASRKQRLVKMDWGGIFPQPRGVGSAKRITEPNLGQPGGFVLSTSSAQQAAMGRKGGLSCNLTSVLRYVWMDGWMEMVAMFCFWATLSMFVHIYTVHGVGERALAFWYV